jgi:DNA-binding GntR family transcriptional regulator
MAIPTTPPAAKVPERKPSERKGRLHQDAVTVLRQMIHGGEFTPGDRLREVLISQRLGMSRTPVREAFRTLAAEGLVELLPNRSVVVRDLNKEESVDIFHVLGALESLAAQQAAQRMTEDDMDKLRALQDDLEERYEARDRPAYTETNRAIHRLMVEAARNPSLLAAWRLIVPRAERARTLNNVDPKRWASSIDAHRKIYAALLARDGHLLSSLMQAHFADSIIQSMSLAEAKRRPVITSAPPPSVAAPSVAPPSRPVARKRRISA